jgi:RNA polymerase sigma-70 factor (ECF subfamily)
MSPAPAEASLALLQRIQRGDESAWNDLYRRYRDRLLFAIRRRLGSELRSQLESEDVLQSVVREALTGLRDFTPDGDGALGRYLHVCVLNKIRKKAAFHGAQRRRGAVPLTDSLAERLGGRPGGGGGLAELRYVDDDRFLRLERELQRLPEPMRTVVELRACEGRTNAEVAQDIGKSEEAAKKLYQRAIARLGVMLADSGTGARES